MTNAIECRDLRKRFGARFAVDGVTFDLPEGAFLSIFGPNGAGKTTLLRMLATLSRATDGTACVGGFDLREEPDAVRSKVGMISHEPMLYPDLTAQENLEFFASLYGVANPGKRSRELLAAVGLKHRRLDAVRTFSRGMTQRLAIARALVNDPEILFLDEPYSGLDPHAVDVFDQLIDEVRDGRTFVMVSHDLDRGLQLCTHALVMARGKVVSYEEAANLNREAFGQLYRDTVGQGVA